MKKMPKKKKSKKAMKMEDGPFNAAKGSVVKSKRGGPKAAKKKVVKKK